MTDLPDDGRASTAIRRHLRYRPGSKQSGSREQTIFWLAVATAGGIGILGIAGSVTHTPPLQNEAVAEVAHGVFEALFIAAFVAAIVDPFAKRRFAIEVGRSVLLALFGRNAPQRYIDGLREALRPDRITYDVQWHLQLTWHIPDQLLRIDIRIDSSLQNISERPMAPTPAWLPSSAPGSPGSTFHEYRIKVTPTDSPATAAVSRRLDADALQSAVRAAGIGWIAVDPDRALGDLQIPPGAIQDFTLAGVTYQPAPDPFLLVLSNPALSQTLTISGPALRDLKPTTFFGIRQLRCSTTNGKRERCQYHIDELAFPGATWRIHWEPHNPPSTAASPDS